MRNILKKNLLCMIACVMAGIAFAQTTTGTYTKRVISSDGKTSTWTFDVVSGSAQTVPDNTDDNGILYINGGGSNKAQTSKYFSFNKSEFYIEVPSGSAGKISMAQYSSGSDGRWFQLYVNGTEGPSTKRLWSKAGDGTDGKKGPQSFDFVSSDITSKGDKTYLYFKTNGTEMKVSSFTITLTTGSYIGPAPKSKDATLSDLKVDGVTIDGFAASKTSYDYSVAATATTAPVVSATKNDTKAADPVITQAALPTAGNPTQATVKVTAEDEETTMTYTITFTRAELSHDATLKEIKVDGVPVSGFSPATETYNVSVPYSQTAMPVVTATANNGGTKPLEITQPTAVPGSATIKVTAEDGTTTKTYPLNFTRAAASNDATLKELTYNGKSVPGFSPSNLNYQVELANGSAAPTVAATPNHPFAKAVIQQSQTVDGKAIVTVTAEDGNTQKQYTIQFSEAEGIPVPPTSLLIHMPGKYEDPKGYGTPLTVLNNQEYEVYYTEHTSEGDYPTFSTTLATDGKATGISGSTSSSANVGRPGDTWFKGTIESTSECKKASSKDEFKFETKMIREHRLGASDTYQFHVKGYDQFSLWGMDKKIDPKNGNQVFVVKVDGVEQPTDASLYNTDSYTIRRYDISSGEHLIEISTTCTGSNVCYMGAVSLRVAKEPRVMHIKGNDSTQTVLQTQSIRPITYYTKYNSFGETKIIWDGAEATGLTLKQVAQTSIGDTLALSGEARCPVGVYTFRVASVFNGKVTQSLPVKIKVESKIDPYGITECEAYQGEEIDQLKFSYFALSGEDVTLSWTGNNPGGITGSGRDGLYLISGAPQNTGTFDFTVSVKDGNSVSGRMIVKPSEPADVLYLYKNNNAFDEDGVYNYLKSKFSIATRKAKEDGLRAADQYAKYKWILISEDADADNAEVLAVSGSGAANLPVLSMKSFAYGPDRLDWGEPNNGSLTENARSITVEREDHPIFKALNKKHGDKIQILSSIDKKGLMPANVKLQGSLCLATALTRDINNYNGDGEWQTFLHEVPADIRGGKKYICLPIARSSSDKLTADGQKLIDAIVKYLTSSEPSVEIPTTQITRFVVDGVIGEINQAQQTIYIDLDLSQHKDLDLTAVKPVVAVADPTYTHVIPSANEAVDFSASMLAPVEYVVTDYINRTVYKVTLHTYTSEGIEDVYVVGEWVNIFDIYGRKIATTNENIYTMDLPRGVYLIVNENGKTAKIFK